MAKHAPSLNFRVDLLDAHGNLSEGLFEDVPAMSAGSGAIAGIGVGPQGEPGVVNTPKAKQRRRKKAMPMQRIKPIVSVGSDQS